jgi:hypothetical protein
MKKILQRLMLTSAIFCALFTVAIFGSSHETYAASTARAVPAATCYSQATQIGPYTIIPTDFYLTPDIIKGPACNDINYKSTIQAGTIQARVIFKNVSTGAIKGYGSWKTISSVNTWYVLASSVLNGTRYTLEFKDPYKGTTFEGWQAS